MNRNHKFVTTLIAITFALAAPFASAKGKPDFAGPPAGSTIVETAIALSGTPGEFDDNGDDFDILVAAVVATGVNDSVLNGEYDYTVFAPNDAGFLATCSVLAGEAVTDEGACVGLLVGALGVSGVEGVLAYHVAEGVRNSTSVSNARSVKMLDGNRISVDMGMVDGIGTDAALLATDIRVSDGLIHVIDFVLLPFEL
jgi:uncharacterized surface protein with fasciclin (FAS1) repeats